MPILIYDIQRDEVIYAIDNIQIISCAIAEDIIYFTDINNNLYNFNYHIGVLKNLNKKAKSVSCSRHHVLIIDENDWVWSWYHQSYPNKPSKFIGQNIDNAVKIPIQAHGIFTSYDNSFIIDKEYNVHIINQSLYNRFLVSAKESDSMLFIPDLKSIKIASGIDFILTLSPSGKLYSMGDNADGQLGTGDYDDSYRLNFIDIENIADISAGDDHSIVLDSSGKLYAFGNNEQSQLLSFGKSFINIPSVVPGRYKSISAAGNYTICINEDNVLWSNYGEITSIKAERAKVGRNGIAVIDGIIVNNSIGGCIIS